MNIRLSRRRVLGGIGLGWLAGACHLSFGSARRLPLLLSPVQDRDGQCWLHASTLNGGPVWRHPLPSRGHGVAIHPDNSQLVIAGRRPATWLVRVKGLESAEVDGIKVEQFAAQKHRHFLGHIVYSPRGDLLYATENDFQRRRGIIGIYDAGNLKRLGEWTSGGIGPHELKVMKNEDYLAVANGGILTHPSRPREKLNLHSMRPNLSILKLSSGTIQQQYTLPESQMSIRHLDIDRMGRVWVACQYEGDNPDPSPLVAYTTAGGQLQWAQGFPKAGHGLTMPVWGKLSGYCGSICCHPHKPVTAVTLPPGSSCAFLE